jgi:hypothetical protein
MRIPYVAFLKWTGSGRTAPQAVQIVASPLIAVAPAAHPTTDMGRAKSGGSVKELTFNPSFYPSPVHGNPVAR